MIIKKTLQGRDLIVAVDNVAVAAAKSCTLNVEVDTIEIARHNTQNWKEFTTGLKEWKVSTSQILESQQGSTGVIEVMSTSHNGVDSPSAEVNIVGNKYTISGRGITLFYVKYNSAMNTYTVSNPTTYDTYDNPSLCQDIYNELLQPSETADFLVMCSCDAITIDQGIEEVISQDYNSYCIWQVTQARVPFAAILSISTPTSSVAAMGELNCTARLKMQLQGSHPVLAKPMVDQLNMIGKKVWISVKADGLPNDQIQGWAICREWKEQGSINNLVQGSFSFTGTGPLTPRTT